jgi:hypothetical protein
VIPVRVTALERLRSKASLLEAVLASDDIEIAFEQAGLCDLAEEMYEVLAELLAVTEPHGAADPATSAKGGA